MELRKLKAAVFEANMALQKSGLVLHTFGNVSGIDSRRKVVVIKPSGVAYDTLSPEQMVPVELESGRVIDSDLNPSSDTATHLELYRAFPACAGIVHTHSEFATACAQARIPIRCMGTTHADYFYGDIPVTRSLIKGETVKDYEKNTGRVIVERFRDLNPETIPAVLVANHGPFVWGRSPAEAVFHAQVVEFLARLELHTRQLNPAARRPPRHLVDKHFRRKHGKNAYYGQKKG